MNDKPIHEQDARAAIDGAIAYGRMGVNPPPLGHWLAEYWHIGQQLAELGKTSALDNMTPVDAKWCYRCRKTELDQCKACGRDVRAAAEIGRKKGEGNG